MKTIISILLLSLMVACQPTATKAPTPSDEGSTNGGSDGGSSGGSGTSSTTPGWRFPTSSSSIQYAFMGLPYSHTVLTGLSGGAATWTITTSQALPAGLSLSNVGTTAVISGVPTGHSVQLNGFTVTAVKGGSNQTATFTFFVRGDILRPYQWHLENDGASVFSDETGTADEDMDVLPVWRAGYYGQGIRVAVSDSGVEVSHEDLSSNLISGMHRNYYSGSSSNGYLGNPSPMGDAHGTAVSGIIGAVGWNNKGGTGVAPQARLAGFQFIESDQDTAIMISQSSGVFDIFNYSYGSGANFDFEDDALYIAHLRDRVKNGRNGLGQIYVKAAGNEYVYFCGDVGALTDVCAPQNANIPMENNSPFNIVVSATDSAPIAADYSNAGSNIWVSAPGGEYGDDRPAIVSTDLMGCSQGYSTTTGLYKYNQFEVFSTSSSIFTTFNSACNYTSTMNGTSSAAPNVSGVIALMLSANPNLSWRDVKHILAVTADQVHAAAGNTNHYEASLRLPNHVYEQGWVTNTAGYHHHNWYGFGRVNAEAAINMATSGYTSLPNWFETNPDFDDVGETKTGLNIAIPDANNAAAPSALSVSDSMTLSLPGVIAETVQVKVQVTHPNSGQVGVELTSPGGTKSILLNINNALIVPYSAAYQADQNLDVVLTSHAFYGEPANGTWTLKLIDGLDDNKSGTLTGWSINILGH